MKTELIARITQSLVANEWDRPKRTPPRKRVLPAKHTKHQAVKQNQ